MPHGYQTARRRAVDAAQNVHREPTEDQINAVEAFFDSNAVGVYGLDSDVDERAAIRALLEAAFNG